MNIREKFKTLNSKEDVADLLQISIKFLNVIVGGRRISNYYEIFEIPKKNGKYRKIAAPSGDLLLVLNRLKPLLNDLYEISIKRNHISHGFISGKSIKSNAEIHLGNKFLLNVDLKDFFPSISYGRVKGLFQKGFAVGEEAAKYLALLVCYNGTIPQGSPCSPIISNMICKRLDSDLYKLSRKYRLSITRYADDISISSKCNNNFNKVCEDGMLTEEFTQIINDNWFKINTSKTWISYPGDKKEVTGLVINEHINVPRKFVRNLRARLHQTHYISVRLKNKRFNELFGRVNYLAYIKGYEDPVFIRYALKFNELYEGEFFNVDKEQLDEDIYINNRIVLIGYDVMDQGTVIEDIGNGTGFYIKIAEKFYIMTCYHVLQKAIESCQKFRIYHKVDDSNEVEFINEYKFPDYKINNSYTNKSEDLLFIELSTIPDYFFEFENIDEMNLERGAFVTSVGFPNFNFSNMDDFAKIKTTITSLNVTTRNTDMIINIIGVNENFPHGMSGGPVLNSNNKVVGMVSNGLTYLQASSKVDEMKAGFIPGSRILKLIHNSIIQRS